MSIVAILIVILTLTCQWLWSPFGWVAFISWGLMSALILFLAEEVNRWQKENANKDTFVSIAAHQIRNPLTGIKWALDLLQRGHLGAQETADFIKKTYDQNERLIFLVNDLLNISRISAGRFVYHLRPANLATIWHDVEQTLRLPLEQKRLVLTRHLVSLPNIVIDPEKIQLALQNLLDNAIKFTPQGQQIEVVFLRHGQTVEILVRDHGIGIPRDQQDKIFQRFFRAENAQRSGHSGTGLGLYLAKTIIEHHGGKLWFESVENISTTFHVSLPLK